VIAAALGALFLSLTSLGSVSALAESWTGPGLGPIPLTSICVLGDPVYIVGKASEKNSLVFPSKKSLSAEIE
jgi:hypothetical protein